MKSVREVAHAPLTWIAARRNPVYQLLSSGGDVVATLHQSKLPNARITVRTAEDSWIFKQKNYVLKESFSISTSETEIAWIEFGLWRASRLKFSDGKTFQWTHSSPFSTESLFLDENDVTLIRFRSQNWSNSKIVVRASQVTLQRPELALLMTFGCYVKTYREALAI